MKIRNGFVSNSSSSSFICDVCGEAESGWDMCLTEANMVECEKGHTLCTGHISGKLTREIALRSINENRWINRDDQAEKKKKFISELASLSDSEVEDLLCEDHDVFGDLFSCYNIPYELCPICSLSEIGVDDILKYVLKKYSINKDNIIKEIRDQFKTREELYTELNRDRKKKHEN